MFHPGDIKDQLKYTSNIWNTQPKVATESTQE